MHAVQERLKSTAGATLSVALLFFIMCAAAGSVILAAATTTSGRLSELRATDQNYYAVVSAARLLQDEINGQAIAVQQTETKTVTTTRKESTETDADGAAHTVVTEETETKYTYSKPAWLQKADNGTIEIDGIKFNPVDATDSPQFFLLDALKNKTIRGSKEEKRTGSLTYVYKTTGGSDSFTSREELSKNTYDDSQDAFDQKLMNDRKDDSEIDSLRVYTDTLQISAELGNEITDSLFVEVRIIMDARGAITAHIRNHSEENAKKKGNEYRLKLTLEPKEVSQELSQPSVDSTVSGDTTTETTKTTQYSYVTWQNPQIMKDTDNNVWTD